VGRERGLAGRTELRDVLVGCPLPAGRPASMHCATRRRRIRACRTGLSGATAAGAAAARGADDERTNEYTTRKWAEEEVRGDELGGARGRLSVCGGGRRRRRGGDKENEDGRAGPEALYRFSGALHAWMMCRVL
jgi:hypothetical protein